MEESADSNKRPRLSDDHEPQEARAKYCFVNYDAWLLSQDTVGSISTTVDESLIGATPVTSGARPAPAWFSLGADSSVSQQCRSAQYSAVAHSPFTHGPGDSDNLVNSLFVSADGLEKFSAFRLSLPDTLAHPYADLSLFRAAEITDVVSNGVRRDPTLYKSVWPETMMGVSATTGGVADLAVAQTPVQLPAVDRMPWQWELNHRAAILTAIVEAVAHCQGDMLVPFRGLILSQWVGGVVFRLAQIFLKITIVRSQLTPRWDDSCFIFCQTRRPSSKLVDKAVKMLAKLKSDVQVGIGAGSGAGSGGGGDWGYSAPPVCFADPAVVSWLKSVNAQLIGVIKLPYTPPTQYASIERLASQFRLKKFLFPQELEQVVGFYFGSFSPVHENHVALARFALDNLGIGDVVFVPNFDGNEEKHVLPLPDRVGMLRARLHNDDRMHVIQPTAQTKRWEAKAAIADETVANMFADSRVTGVPALLLGQDSWNKAVLGSSRDKTTRHFIGISKLVKEKFFIFPRTDQQEPVLPAPKPIRDNVVVVEGFNDPIPGLSSSRIREAIAHGQDPDGIDNTVLEYIRANRLYSSE